MKIYYLKKTSVKNKKLISLEYNDEGDTLDVYCEDLDYCFRNINAPVLNRSMRQIGEFIDRYNHDPDNADKIVISSQENFRVLLVGGFSNFIAVEEEVRKHPLFESTTVIGDKRFEPFPFSDRALSISKGAAWIANGRVKIIDTCFHTYGYIVYSKNETHRMVPKDVPVVKMGTKLEELDMPMFKERPVGVTDRLGNKSGVLTIFMDDGWSKNEGRICVDLKIEDLFPDVDHNKRYYIDFTVDEDQIPTIHVKNEDGPPVSTSLNKLIEKIAIREK